MRIDINLADTVHEFERVNLVSGPNGVDTYKCKLCGVVGQRKRLSNMISVSGPKDRVMNCVNKTRNKSNPDFEYRGYTKVKVTNCTAVGNMFSNLTPDSIHEIIEPPIGESNKRGEWVMGVGEPVLLLFHEFDYIK